MSVGKDLADCLGVDVKAFDPSIFEALITSFLLLPPKLIIPNELVLLLPDLANPIKLIVSPISAQIPKPLGDLDLDPGSFDPQALIDFVTGLGNIALGIPDLFGLPKLEIVNGSLDLEGLALDLLGPPIPIPKPPSLDALVQLIALSIGINPNAVPPGFPTDFAKCLAAIIAVPLGIR